MQATADDAVGRYQLVPAIIETNGPIGVPSKGIPAAGNVQERVLFKIDTTSGKTWEFVSVWIKGELVEEWVEIKEKE